MKVVLNKLKDFILVVFVLLVVTSCYSSRIAVRTLSQNTQSFQSGNFAALQTLTQDILQTAEDDDKGSLYYGGLLLYFNEYTDKAEIALRRSARTGKTPWSLESARLVVYFMTIDFRYNQIQPFLESIFTHQQIIEDSELFYYYSFALFLTKQYDTLAALLEEVPDNHTWNTTLRQRVSLTTTSFIFDFWKALLQIRKFPQNSDPLFSVLVSHSSQSMVENIQTLLDKIYTETNPIPENIKNILDAKIALQTNSDDAKQKLLSLDQELFIHAGMLEDLREVFNNDKRQSNLIEEILKKSTEYVQDEVQSVGIDVFLGFLYYNRGDYSRSYEFYNQAFQKKSYSQLSKDKQNTALWRMLFSRLQKQTNNFLTKFNEVIAFSKDSEYFANLLEEYLSKQL